MLNDIKTSSRLSIETKGEINTWINNNNPDRTSYFEYEMTYNYYKMIYDQIPTSSLDKESPRTSQIISIQEAKEFNQIKNMVSMKLGECFNNNNNNNSHNHSKSIDSPSLLQCSYSNFVNSTNLPSKYSDRIREIEEWLNEKESFDIEKAKENLKKITKILIEMKVYIYNNSNL